jgi:hypothetical protein
MFRSARLFLAEQSDPDSFYAALARDAVGQLEVAARDLAAGGTVIADGGRRPVRDGADVDVIAARPRYYPRWCRALLLIPGLRELATWNLLLILRRAR